MIYFYYGENLYTLEEKLGIFRERYNEKFSSGLNFINIDFEEDNLDKIRSAIETHSMFDEKKLIFVRDTFSLKQKIWEDLINIINKNNLIDLEDVVVVFYEKKSKKELEKKSKKIFSYFIKSAKSEEFKNLEGSRLINWLKNKTNAQGGNISNSALYILIEKTNNDTLRTMNELEKLIIFKNGELIEDKDVEFLVTSEVKSDIFRTIDSLSKKDVVGALKNLQKHWLSGDDPLAILGMFIYELRILILLKETEEKGKGTSRVQKEFNLHPYVIKKNLLAVKKFSLNEIRVMYQHLAEADLAIKIGKKEPQKALEDFIYQCLSPITK